MNPRHDDAAIPARRRRLPAEARRIAVVEAAMRHMAEHGLERFRTRDVAEAAGINSATLHHHFPTKNDLLEAVADEIERQFSTEKTGRAADAGDAIVALRAQFADARSYRDDRPTLVSAYRELSARASRDAFVNALAARLDERWRSDIRATVAAGIVDGSLRADLDPAATSAMLMNAIWGTLTSATSGSASELEAVCAQMLRLIERERREASDARR